MLKENGGKMIFQILDDRDECFGIYSNGEFTYDRVPHDVRGTWSYAPVLSGHNIDYANIFVGGRKIEDVCPEGLSTRLKKREKKIKAFINSAINAKMNVSEFCMFEVVPEQHLRHYCEVKNEICSYIFENCEKPQNHQFMVDLFEMAHDISQNNVIVDRGPLKKASKHDGKARTLLELTDRKNTRILYDTWGTKTGRLTTKQGSFPIMNLKKELANCVIPKNDLFVQLDLNGAEIRTLLSLSTGTHPREDIHEFNMKNVYRGIGTRDKAKKRFFAWLYNPNSKDYLTGRYYNRTMVLKKFYSNGEVYTPFGRKIPSDDFHALNYLLQSTSSDNCMKQVCKINKFLRNTRSFVHSVVHDSMTIDLSIQDRHLLTQIKEVFEDTELGWFMSSVHLGSNLRDMMEVSWS